METTKSAHSRLDIRGARSGASGTQLDSTPVTLQCRLFGRPLMTRGSGHRPVRQDVRCRAEMLIEVIYKSVSHQLPAIKPPPT